MNIKSFKTVLFAAGMALASAPAASAADITGTTFTNEPASVVWNFNNDADYAAANAVLPEARFSMTVASIGNAKTTGTSGITVTDKTYIKVKPAIGKDDLVKWNVKAAKGLAFTPTKISGYIAKFGSDAGGNVINVTLTLADGTTEVLGSYIPPRNNVTKEKDKYGSDPKYAPYFEISLSAEQQKKFTTSGILTLSMNIGVDTSKEGGFSDIHVDGLLNGTALPVEKFTLKAAPEQPECGSVTVYPDAASFEEDTEITVTASENFGYHFKNWTDASGKAVSEENPYTFKINSNTTLTANYAKSDVFALNLAIEGGANVNQVQFLPEGNVVDGVHYYEAGTDVRLTAIDNRILTFTNWEDNTTAPERNVKMDGEKNFTAKFSAADYIVGWDFYFDQPNSERPADFKAESDNAGLLSLHNAAGQTSTWLTRGVSNGAENGKWGARIWKSMALGHYFEVSFSSVGYKNLVLSAALGVSFNTRSVNNVEYSTDGTIYHKFGTYNLEKGWTSNEFPLPADAAGKERVWIRFMPDNNSPLVGSATDNDGLCIAELFILADKEAADDNVAPKLVGIIPADGSEGASATGSIILTFDEKVKLGTGNATLNGETITPRVSGKSVVYNYAGLDYATVYNFSVPAGAVTDRSGNPFEGISTSFKTLERVQPEARLYDAIVAADGSGDYTTVQAAIDAAPENRVKPWLIFVKNGRYKEHVNIPANKPMLHFIGQDRDKAVILDDKLCGGDNALHVSVGATVVVYANDCLFENITLENSYGHEKQTGPQALALNTIGDRTVFNNVAMLSYQDTWITPSTSNYRAYVRNSFIEGAVDFIYNSGNIYIDNTTLYINRKSGGYIVAPSHGADVEWGYVFNNCTITAPGVPSETSVWLGRPWHNQPKTVFLNTRAEVTIPATGWYETMGGLPAIWADWNTTDGNGNLVDLSQRRDTYYKTGENGQKIYGKAKNRLTDEEAAEYTVKNVLSGSDNWAPVIKTESCAAPKPVLSDGVISWEAVPYAICYLVSRGDEVIDFTTDLSMAVTAARAGSDVYTVQAVNEFGGLSAKGSTDGQSGISDITADADAEIIGIYDLQGRSLPAMTKGINIVMKRSADGSVRAEKMIVR